jgi:hypothetical protein
LNSLMSCDSDGSSELASRCTGCCC